eukprot:COSAG06_NODE_4197_length_4485_cov_7.345645_5_plen_108_part_00
MFFAGVIVHVPHINDGGKIIERSSFLRRFVSSYLLTTEHLPRQARDKHIRENSTKTFCLLFMLQGTFSIVLWLLSCWERMMATALGSVFSTNAGMVDGWIRTSMRTS